MPSNKSTYDVFISYSHKDRPLAAQVADVMGTYGLDVFYETADVKPGTKFEDTVWDAMAESRAFVVIIPAESSVSSMSFELGAAKAWNKPIFVVASQHALTPLPTALHGAQVYPMSRVNEIAESIARSTAPVSEHDKKILVETYMDIGLPVDQLVLQPRKFAEFVKRFNKRSQRQLAGEQIMSSLLRSRKHGLLPPITKRTRRPASKP